MRCIEFQLLTTADQVNLLYKEGVYLGKRKEDEQVILLYQVDGFYAEVIYLNYRLHIDTIIASDSLQMLEPYLEQIDVEYLVNE